MSVARGRGICCLPLCVRRGAAPKIVNVLTGRPPVSVGCGDVGGVGAAAGMHEVRRHFSESEREFRAVRHLPRRRERGGGREGDEKNEPSCVQAGEDVEGCVCSHRPGGHSKQA